jgi:hypothetical protein
MATLLCMVTRHVRINPHPAGGESTAVATERPGAGQPRHGTQRHACLRRAHQAVNRPDLCWRDLCAASAMFLDDRGATTINVQHHLDHATAAAALRYQGNATAQPTPPSSPRSPHPEVVSQARTPSRAAGQLASFTFPNHHRNG